MSSNNKCSYVGRQGSPGRPHRLLGPSAWPNTVVVGAAADVAAADVAAAGVAAAGAVAAVAAAVLSDLC